MHIVQRGNNRQHCFHVTRDYEVYLRWLEGSAKRYGVDVHAYVLMTNHVHLLVTPPSDSAPSRMMQQLGRKYVPYFNTRYQRSGTLWEGRFRSSLIETDHYLLGCYRYIELNPVRARMVSSPSSYQWSSYRTNAFGKPSPLITSHEVWDSLGNDPKERQENYRRLFDEKVDEQTFRYGYRNGLPVGSGPWRNELKINYGIRIAVRRPGRRKKDEM